MGWWIAALALPVGIAGLYETFMWWHYGTGGLFNAAGYAGASQAHGERLSATLTVLTFTGGCVASAAFYLPVLRVRFLPASLLAFAAVILCALVFLPRVDSVLANVTQNASWLVAIQVAAFASVGLIVPTLAIRDLRQYCDANSALLFLWVTGTLLFSAYLDWSVTARTILPIAPAAGILVVRRLESTRGEGIRFADWKWYAPLVPSLVLAFAVAWADARLANSAREAAQRFGQEMAGYPHAAYFQGHWGFQYYMEAVGAEPVAYGKTSFSAGDAIICPLNNTSVWPVDESLIADRYSGEFGGPAGLTTMSRPLGAGFYTDLWGPLPYAFGPVPGERYVTFVLNGAGIPFQDVTYHD